MDFNKINQIYKTVPYIRKPENLNLDEWQYALRKKYAETHTFRIENVGSGTVFSDYMVYNPETKNSYKVAIRSAGNEANFCECSDFKTNALGTCKHIEATLFYIINDLKKENLLNLEFSPNYTSIYLDYRDQRKIKIRLGYDHAEEFKRIANTYFEKDFVLKEDSIVCFDEVINKSLAISSSFRCYPDAMARVINLREYYQRNRIIEDTYASMTVSEGSKSFLRVELYPYQWEGVIFSAKAGRCIIADDMGLGKTVQAIAAAYLLKKEQGISKVLVICPTSLKFQWQNEILKFTGDDSLIVEGNAQRRQTLYQADEHNSFIKITSYQAAINDLEVINNEDFDLVILDEAQRIKNFRAKISREIKKIQSPYCFVLTGTPLENKLEELYSIVQYVDSFVMGPYYKYIFNHQLTDDSGKVVGYKDLDDIGKRLQTIMIRRKKVDVLTQLPERIDKVLEVPMTFEQQKIHDEYANSVAQIINKWKSKGSLNEKDRQRLMICLNMMRMVCDSTYVIDQESRHDTKIDELLNIIEEATQAGEEKVVVFSQWERMTRIIATELEKRNIVFESLNGQVPGNKRGKIFANFNENPGCKVFISTDVGGVGLNLQAASLLINMDIPWNPAVLEQRIARIYRIGQKKNVAIINMVSKNTIEHKMLEVIGFKKSLSEGVLDHGDSTIFLGESKFKKFMETVENITTGIPISTTDLADADEHEKRIRKEELLQPGLENENVVQGSLFGDDDIIQDKENVTKVHNQFNLPESLIQKGKQVLSGLTELLQDEKKTKEFISSLIEKDEKSGQTYLKVPVENEQFVEGIFDLLNSYLTRNNTK